MSVFSFIHVSVTTRNEVSLRFFKKRDNCSCLLLRLLQFIYQNLGNSDFLAHSQLYFSIVVILSKFDGPGFLSMSPHFCGITTMIISRYFMLNIPNHSKKFQYSLFKDIFHDNNFSDQSLQFIFHLVFHNGVLVPEQLL